MPSSTPPPTGHKFLLDENVHAGLLDFLHAKSVDAVRVVQGSKDSEIASASKAEHRIVVTNDADFTQKSTNEIFGVVWLRIRQKDVAALLAAFEKLLAEWGDFEGKLIVLHPEAWEVVDLGYTDQL
jgi:predicted nuclease of predicted toxin-antitoxin system